MAWASPACSAGALVAASLTTREDLQSVHPHLGIVHLQRKGYLPLQTTKKTILSRVEAGLQQHGSKAQRLNSLRCWVQRLECTGVSVNLEARRASALNQFASLTYAVSSATAGMSHASRCEAYAADLEVSTESTCISPDCIAKRPHCQQD